MTGPSDTCSCCHKCGAAVPCASSLAGDYCDSICFCGLPLAEGDEAESLWGGPEPVGGDEIFAVRWVAGTIPDDERETARARLVASGRVLGEDGRWRKVGPEPVAGEIVAKRGGR